MAVLACCELGSVVEVTRCDAQFLTDTFGDQLEDMALLCRAILRQRAAQRQE